MCYCLSTYLTEEQLFRIEHDFVLNWEEEEKEDYYVASGFVHPKLPVLTAEKTFRNYRWGLIPHWTKDWNAALKIRVQCLNAISEEAESKPSFRDAIKAGQFCVIPVNGFYEWHQLGKEKYPHYIYPKDGGYFLFAGLYNQWVNKAIGEVHNTFTILTTRANERMEWIHNVKKRMPVILDTEQARIWLDKEVSYGQKKQLLEPCDPSLMADHPVSKLITSRKENPNQPKVMERFDYPELLLS